MDENPTVGLLRAYVERLEARDWSGFADLLHPDVIYRMPQTRDVVRGRDAYLRWNREYPGIWHLRLVEAYGHATGGVARVDADVDGEGTTTAIAFFAVDGDLITELLTGGPRRTTRQRAENTSPHVSDLVRTRAAWPKPTKKGFP